MKLTIHYGISALLGGILLLGAAPAWAQLAQRGTRTDSGGINVTADKLGVGDGGSQIEATGNVEIKRQQTTIKADEVRMNRTTQDVEAKGRVVLDDPEWKVKSAESVQLNLEQETGKIEKGDIFIEQGHVSMTGRRLEKFAGQSYHVDDTFFTTCICESGAPSWKISAESMDLDSQGLATIRNGYFYILDFPVFYLPYGFFPLKTERQSGFLIPKIGQSTTDGFRYQQPFFWAPSKSTDATVAVDIQSRTRIGGWGELRTIFDRDSDFRIHGSYFNEGWRKGAKDAVVDRTIADQDIPKNRWSVIGSHRYLLPSQWFTYSDFAAYRDDLFTRELVERFDLPVNKETQIRQSRFAESRLGFFRSWGDTHFRGEASFYQDFIQKDETTLQRTPQLSLWGTRLVSGFPLEFRWRAEGTNYLRRDGGDGLRLDLRPEAVLPFRMGSYLQGFLSAAPRETVYHLYSPVKSSRNVSRELVELRGNVGSSMSRVFSWSGSELRAVKHVIEPELSYLFTPRIDQSRIPIMDGADRINRRNVFTLGLANRFWGKFVNPLVVFEKEKDVELVNPLIGADVREIASLKLALSYDVDKERKGGDSLSDFDVNLRITPTNYLTLAFDGGFNPGPWNITQARWSFGVSDPRPITRRSLDADFNRPSSINVNYSFLRRGPNGFLSEDANIDLDAPPSCASRPSDPRCPGTAFNKSIVGGLGGSVFYHVTDRMLFFATASYDVRDASFPGYRGAVKLLSPCECWTLTLSLNHTMNPAKTSFNFDINILGMGTQKGGLK